MAEVGRIQIEVDAKDVKRATDALDKMGISATRAGKKAKGYSTEVKGATKQTKGMSRAALRVSTALKAVGVSLAGISIVGFARQVGNATTQLNNIEATLRVASGSAEEAASNMEFLRAESERLGLFLPSVAKQMAQFAAAAKTSSMTTQDLRDTFTGVAEASRALGLSAAQTDGAMLALQQMMSKGKVSAEELRQQLGERLPGSIQIMAQALNVTTTELYDMMQNGELMSDVVLPKFGRELQRVFGAQATVQANNLAAAIARIRTAFFDLMAQDEGLSGATEAIDNLADVIASEGFQRGFDNLITGASNLLGVLGKNLNVIVNLTKAATAFFIGVLSAKAVGIVASMTSSLTSMVGAVVATNTATLSLIGSMTALSTLLSRIAWPIAAISAVATAIGIYTEKAKEAKTATQDWSDILPPLSEDLTTFGREGLQRIAENAERDIQQLEFIRDQIDEVREELARPKRGAGLRNEALREELDRLQNIAEGYKGVERQAEKAERALLALRMQTLEANAAGSKTSEASEAEVEYTEKLVELGVSQENAAELAEIYAEKNDRVKQSLLDQLEVLKEMNRNDLVPPGMRGLSLEAQQERIDVLAKRREDAQEAAAKRAEEKRREANRRAEALTNTNRYLEQAKNKTDQWEDSLIAVKDVMERDLSDSLTDVIMQVDSLSDAFENLLNQIARTIIQRQISDPFVESITGGIGQVLSGGFSSIGGGAPPSVRGIGPPQGGVGGFLSGIGDFFGGFFANGGNVTGGRAHVVGERGPELFVPSQDGRIIPNNEMNGGAPKVTVNVINQGGDQLEAQQQQSRRGPNGEMTVDVMVKSSMERLDSQGQLDGIFRRHGARRQGQF